MLSQRLIRNQDAGVMFQTRFNIYLEVSQFKNLLLFLDFNAWFTLLPCSFKLEIAKQLHTSLILRKADTNNLPISL